MVQENRKNLKRNLSLNTAQISKWMVLIINNEFPQKINRN